jgi:DtxR family Mn-dependent transcriptional regulator
MERDGLLHVSGDRHLELTHAGRDKAMRVMRKHRLAERLLLDVIGLEWQYVHDEACRWEHVMSERVERKLLGILTDPRESPYGNPIPGLEELGGPAVLAADFRDGVLPLPDALAAAPTAHLVLRRLGEPVQTDTTLMGRLADAGIRPGSGVSATDDGATLRVHGASGSVELPLPVAQHVFVEPRAV